MKFVTSKLHVLKRLLSAAPNSFSFLTKFEIKIIE